MERAQVLDRDTADARRILVERRNVARMAGSMGIAMAQEREALMEGKWWLAVFPGICITLLVLSANMLGDWLRVRLDPQLRNR